MIRTDFKLRYQASVLGYLWSILKPLFIFAILYTIFGKVLKLGAGVPNYALSLLLGIVLWNFFAEATSGALKSVVAKGSLIRKIDIPRYLIPISATASAFINMILNLTVVFLFLAFAQINALSWQTLIIFPVLILELIILTLGVGFFLAAVYVKLRDIDYIWEVMRQALFYAIPIIYPLSRVPTETIQQIMLMNPLVQIIQDARSVITYKGTEQVPDVFSSAAFQLIPITLVLASIFIGVGYFMKKSKHFAENI
ncbi:MAG TPA: ABC transporter permease [Candidatus Saccharimonadales bacterium]|nr:ABC transporter permease [Candidatus Saccharimonadales bacterium]